MENDNINIITNNINKDQEDVFVFDYKDQNMKNNLKFQEWKKKMDIKYKEEKEKMCIKCPFENIYFYGIHCNHDTIIKCPSCDNIFCYCCLKMTDLNNYCCLRRKLIRMHYNGIMYSNSESKFDIKCQSLEFLIPGYNINLLMAIIFNFILPKEIIINMYGRFAIIIFLKLALIIPIIIFSFYISILLILLIIIRIKWYKYIIGILNEEWKQLYKTSDTSPCIIMELFRICAEFLLSCFIHCFFRCCCKDIYDDYIISK